MPEQQLPAPCGLDCATCDIFKAALDNEFTVQLAESGAGEPGRAAEVVPLQAGRWRAKPALVRGLPARRLLRGKGHCRLQRLRGFSMPIV